MWEKKEVPGDQLPSSTYSCVCERTPRHLLVSLASMDVPGASDEQRIDALRAAKDITFGSVSQIDFSRVQFSYIPQ